MSGAEGRQEWNEGEAARQRADALQTWVGGGVGVQGSLCVFGCLPRAQLRVCTSFPEHSLCARLGAQKLVCPQRAYALTQGDRQ